MPRMYHAWIFLPVLFFSSAALAGVFFHHTRNESLAEQLEDQPGRILPSSEMFSFAADVYLFKPFGVPQFYYHGNGYWVNLFAEVRPHEDLALNMKLATSNGASSYGYGRADDLRPFLGVTWRPSLDDDWDLYVRYFDLDRQTLGAGLLLEDKEMNGLILSIGYGDWRYKGLVDGTGGFYRQGDLYYQQIDWRDNLIGASYTFVNYEQHETTTLTNPETGESIQIGEYGHATASLFSWIELRPDLVLRAEAGYRNRAWGSLAGIRWTRGGEEDFSQSWEAQLRRYEPGFGAEISGFVEQDYLSAESEDKSFVEGRNILAGGDGVTVQALRGDFVYQIKWWLKFLSSNEIYSMRYEDHGESGYFYRHAIGYYPYRERGRDSVQFFVGNKNVNVRTGQDKQTLSTLSFEKGGHFGVSAFISF